jgi:hypothetical protein
MLSADLPQGTHAIETLEPFSATVARTFNPTSRRESSDATRPDANASAYAGTIRSTVFATGLHFPTSMQGYGGGIQVGRPASTPNTDNEKHSRYPDSPRGSPTHAPPDEQRARCKRQRGSRLGHERLRQRPVGCEVRR